MQLRNSFVNLVLLLIYHVTTVKGRIENLTVTEGGLCPSDLYYSVDKCMPRGEIHNWVCRYNGRWARRKWKDKKCSGKYVCMYVSHEAVGGGASGENETKENPKENPKR